MSPTPSHIEAVARFASEVRLADLPAEVVRASKRCILDFIGVAIAGSQTPAARLALGTLSELGGAPQARVLMSGMLTSVVNCALFDGIAGHVLDYDDTHEGSLLHPSTPVLAAGLPVAEWRERSGAELLEAHVAAVEIAARAGLAMFPEHYDIGWHMTGTTGSIGASVAVGRLLGLNQSTLQHAIGLAATQAAGHREQFGAMAKSLHAGKAASNGVLAGLLASSGFTAANTSLDGRRGMLRVMSTRADPAELTADLGERWEILRVGLKPYASGLVTHPAIDAIRQLARRHAVQAQDVERISVRAHPLALELTGKRRPRSGREAKFSLSFCVAVTLVDGAARQRQFSDESVARPAVRALEERVSIEAHPVLHQAEAIVTATLRDGSSLSEHVTAATGTPANPMSDAELHVKFLDLVAPVLGPAAAQRSIALVASLENLPHVAELVSACVAAT